MARKMVLNMALNMVSNKDMNSAEIRGAWSRRSLKAL